MASDFQFAMIVVFGLVSGSVIAGFPCRYQRCDDSPGGKIFECVSSGDREGGLL